VIDTTRGNVTEESFWKKKRRERERIKNICLEEIELPIFLECGHVFCVSCLMQYQTANLGKSSCPNCRGDMDVNMIAVDQNSIYVNVQIGQKEPKEKCMSTLLYNNSMLCIIVRELMLMA